MEEGYWIDRKRAAMSMARNASTAEARLIHYEMAGRYSLRAVHDVPFLAAAAEHPDAALRIAAPTPQPFEGPKPGGSHGGER